MKEIDFSMENSQFLNRMPLDPRFREDDVEGGARMTLAGTPHIPHSTFFLPTNYEIQEP